jgi:hypothetical protein
LKVIQLSITSGVKTLRNPRSGVVVVASGAGPTCLSGCAHCLPTRPTFSKPAHLAGRDSIHNAGFLSGGFPAGATRRRGNGCRDCAQHGIRPDLRRAVTGLGGRSYFAPS